ncbi:MAG: accessory factor UbiK family protein [Alphaproteobacteria bacterium]|nr:accessory factor UbiK family protein [Alphaproteobacteria bacterium]
MQTRSTLLDDLSQLMTNAAGVAQGMRDEAQTMMRARVERFLAESQLVTREEFEAVRDMAQKAREENEALSARLVALEAALAAKG